ncbi:MAG: uncharacterized protein QOG33_9 [Gaiellales bacterium]|nr:uncharacterized protein [Gaiellales bacterium]
MIERQLGRPARALAGVAARCPFGAPAVVRQADYLESGEPFPTTFYMTCPAAVARLGELEDAGGVERYQRLLGTDPEAAASYAWGVRRQRELRRPAASMLDGGRSLTLGIGGTERDGAVKCLHAHAAFALAEPRYLFGGRMLAEVEPLFPLERCCCG